MGVVTNGNMVGAIRKGFWASCLALEQARFNMAHKKRDRSRLQRGACILHCFKTGSEDWVSGREIVTAPYHRSILEAAEGDSACLVHQIYPAESLNIITHSSITSSRLADRSAPKFQLRFQAGDILEEFSQCIPLDPQR
jgi:hypothetical protein